MKLFKTRRKVAVVALSVGLIAGIGGAAFAYFTASGTGTGGATVGTAGNLTITEAGAVYNSLSASNTYHQDQCFACASISELGNEITLSSGGRLANVVVPFRNWDAAVTGLNVTFSVYDPSNLSTPLATVTTPINLAAVQLNGRPSLTNVTFDFTNQNVSIPTTVVYKIAFDSSGQGSGVNVALSRSGYFGGGSPDLSIGTDVHPGNIYVTTTDTGAGLNSDSGCSLSTTAGTFALQDIACGGTSNNVGAYGGVTPNANAGSYGGGFDIPAVEFNVVGGTATPPLFPGGPAQPLELLVTNHGSSPVFVNNVLTAVPDQGSCSGSWFNVPNAAVGGNVAPGASVFTSTTINMIDSGGNQNGCQGVSLGLNFSTN